MAIIILSVVLAEAFRLPGRDVTVAMAVLYAFGLICLIMKKEWAKFFLALFGIIGVVDFIIYRVPRLWMIATVTGLLLCYELLEVSFRHQVPVGDEEEHQALIHNHVVYLAVVFTVILSSSFGVLFLFERVALRFSENIYANALVFSLLFFAVLYLLRYVTR